MRGEFTRSSSSELLGIVIHAQSKEECLLLQNFVNQGSDRNHRLWQHGSTYKGYEDGCQAIHVGHVKWPHTPWHKESTPYGSLTKLLSDYINAPDEAIRKTVLLKIDDGLNGIYRLQDDAAKVAGLQEEIAALQDRLEKIRVAMAGILGLGSDND